MRTDDDLLQGNALRLATLEVLVACVTT